MKSSEVSFHKSDTIVKLVHIPWPGSVSFTVNMEKCWAKDGRANQSCNDLLEFLEFFWMERLSLPILLNSL